MCHGVMFVGDNELCGVPYMLIKLSSTTIQEHSINTLQIIEANIRFRVRLYYRAECYKSFTFTNGSDLNDSQVCLSGHLTSYKYITQRR